MQQLTVCWVSVFFFFFIWTMIYVDVWMSWRDYMRLLNGNNMRLVGFVHKKWVDWSCARSIRYSIEIASCKLNVGSSRLSLSFCFGTMCSTPIFSRHMKLYALMRRRRKYTAHSYNHRLASRSTVCIRCCCCYFFCCSSVLYFGFYSFYCDSVCVQQCV